jgi:hypothetical protein
MGSNQKITVQSNDSIRFLAIQSTGITLRNAQGKVSLATAHHNIKKRAILRGAGGRTACAYSPAPDSMRACSLSLPARAGTSETAIPIVSLLAIPTRAMSERTRRYTENRAGLPVPSALARARFHAQLERALLCRGCYWLPNLTPQHQSSGRQRATRAYHSFALQPDPPRLRLAHSPVRLHGDYLIDRRAAKGRSQWLCRSLIVGLLR